MAGAHWFSDIMARFAVTGIDHGSSDFTDTAE